MAKRRVLPMRTSALAAIVLAACPLAAETLAGKVVEDRSGSPLPSVELRVTRSGDRQLAADLETGGDGQFRGAGLPAGDYRIEVLKPNYAPAALTVRLSPQTGPLTIRLARFGAISGHVADAGGKTIPSARIWVFTKAAGGALQAFGNGAAVDDRGQYRVYGLPPGEYSLALAYGASGGAGSGGSASSTIGSGARFYPDNRNPQWFQVAGGEDYADINFTPIPTVLSRVGGKVEPGGRGYAVALTAVDQPYIATASLRLDSKDSAFQFEGIPAGSYDLFASGPTIGFGGMGALIGSDPVFGRVRLEVSGQDVTGVTVPVAPVRTASLILRAASAQQAAACPPTATVSLAPLEASGAMLSRSVVVSFAKPATIAELPPGRYYVAAAALGETCFVAGEVLDWPAATDRPLAVTVWPAASIRGRLGSARPSDYVVTLVPAGASDATEAIQAAYPDADGKFSFTGLRPGRYRIGARATDQSSPARWVADMAKMLEIELPGGAVTEMDLPVEQGK